MSRKRPIDGLNVTSRSSVPKSVKAWSCRSRVYGTNCSGVCTLTPDTTKICMSANATRCRSWSGAAMALARNRLCTASRFPTLAGWSGYEDDGLVNCSSRYASKPIVRTRAMLSGSGPHEICSRNRTAARALTTASGRSASTATAVETAAPGSGLPTVTASRPPGTSRAVPETLNRVGDTNVVVRDSPARRTVDVGTKPLPSMTAVKGPGVILAGVTDEIVGSGFNTVIAADVLAAGLATLVAVSTILVAGGIRGAVYKPSAVIVPTRALPPRTPFRVHISDLLGVRQT